MKIFLRKIIYFVIGFLCTIYRKDVRIVVLAYHGFSSDGWRFSIPVKEFKRQVDYLEKNYQFISVRDLHEYLRGRKKISKPSVLLTIDDGYKDILEIRNYLNELEIKPLLFILSNPHEVDREEIENNKKLLTQKETLALIKDGWSIGSHGATHADFSHLSDQQRNKEIRDSKRRLESALKIKIQYLAYPKGRYDNTIVRDVETSGYQLGFTMDDDMISTDTNRFAIPRVGIDGSHSFFEFTIVPTFWAIQFRKVVKKYFPTFAL